MGKIPDKMFKGIQHIGIPVSDLSISESFYNSLGFMTVMKSTFKHNANTGNVIMCEKESVTL